MNRFRMKHISGNPEHIDSLVNEAIATLEQVHTSFCLHDIKFSTLKNDKIRCCALIIYWYFEPKEDQSRAIKQKQYAPSVDRSAHKEKQKVNSKQEAALMISPTNPFIGLTAHRVNGRLTIFRVIDTILPLSWEKILAG